MIYRLMLFVRVFQMSDKALKVDLQTGNRHEQKYYKFIDTLYKCKETMGIVVQ